jgi:hypothetical protein
LSLGNPFPHGVIAVRIAADAPPLVLAGDLPWRDANARLTPEMPAVRFAVE